MFAIAIDGPAGAGKSSVAKAAAQRLGFLYVDTGAMYRTITLYMLENGINIENPSAVVSALPKVEISLECSKDGQRTFLKGRDVSTSIRTQDISIATSRWVSHIPEVRTFLLELQRGLAEKNNVIMDGRDIGSVILPQAQLKIFLTASAEERARRRTQQLEENGQPADYQEVLQEVIRRDRQDSAQLDLRPKDSILLDSTGLTFNQVVDQLTDIARGRIEAKLTKPTD